MNAQQPDAQEILSLGLRGAYFVPNHGQWSDAQVEYGFRSRGLDVACRQSALTMHMTRENESTSRACEEAVLDVERHAPLAHTRGSSGESVDFDRLTLTITFPGSNAVLPIGAQPQAAKFNYYVGEGRGTASNVPSFGAVVYENLYDGIDLHVMGSGEGVLKYEFHVAPGADYAQIRIAYDGIDSLCIDDAGNLQINTSFGTLADGTPVVWQEGRGTAVPAVQVNRMESTAGQGRDAHATNPVDGRDARPTNDPIPARFELCDARTYRIVLEGVVDPDRQIIIDPDVEWMYYLGGSSYDVGQAVAVNAQGDVLISGWTASSDFEGRGNSLHGSEFDAFVAKVSPEGQLVWMTYLGGSSSDVAEGIALDADNNAYITGTTGSTDFEGRINAFHGGNEALVAKVSGEGQLLWMVYAGGSSDETGCDVAVDQSGDVWACGWTSSLSFEGHLNELHGGVGPDAFVLKANPSGSIQWMRYLGGVGWETAHSMAINSAGDAILTGETDSPDFEGRVNVFYDRIDPFVLRVTADGDLMGMTYLGGEGFDPGFGIALDAEDNALVSGRTDSRHFQGRINFLHGAATDAFLAKVSPSLTVEWMLYLGASSGESGDEVAVDADGNAYVVGGTKSDRFEGRINAFHGGETDAFVAKVTAIGFLEWVRFLGGSDVDAWGGGATDGACIALDDSGTAFVAGRTESDDFEMHGNSSHGSAPEAFLLRLCLNDTPRLSVAASCPGGGPIRVHWSNATPQGIVKLLAAADTGSLVIPGGYACAGTYLRLGVTGLRVVAERTSDADGTGSISGTAGRRACSGYLQLLDLTTCRTSNVARVE